MPFSMYSLPNLDLALLGAAITMRLLGNAGAVTLPPIPGNAEPTYINALSTRVVLDAIIRQTGWNISEGLFYNEIVPILTNPDVHRPRSAQYLGQGPDPVATMVYVRPEGRPNEKPISIRGIDAVFPAGTLRVDRHGAITSPYTVEWHGGLNRRLPYLVLTPQGQRALTRPQATKAWAWKPRGGRWEDILPAEEAQPLRAEPPPGRKRGRPGIAEGITLLLADYAPEELTPEVRDFLYGPSDLPPAGIRDLSKLPDDVDVSLPLFFDTVQVLEAVLAAAEQHLDRELAPPADLYSHYSRARSRRRLPRYQRHPTGWAGTEELMEYLVAYWDITFGSPDVCGRVFRELVSAHWPTDFMAYKIMCRHPRFVFHPHRITVAGVPVPGYDAYYNRLWSVQAEYGRAWGTEAEWPEKRRQMLQDGAWRVAVAAAVSLWSAERIAAFMQRDDCPDALRALVATNDIHPGV